MKYEISSFVYDLVPAIDVLKICLESNQGFHLCVYDS